MVELSRPVEDLNGVRPERFACPDCRAPTFIDLDNYIRPHGSRPTDCSGVGQRVAVRWFEEFTRCPKCREPVATIEGSGRVQQHMHRDEPCGGSGQRGEHWRWLKFGDGSVVFDDDEALAPLKESAKSATRDKSAKSVRPLKSVKSAKPEKSAKSARPKRTRLERSHARPTVSLKRQLEDLVRKGSTPGQVDERAARSAAERAAERSRIAETKKQERRGRILVQIVSGGLPGTARRR